MRDFTSCGWWMEIHPQMCNVLRTVRIAWNQEDMGVQTHLTGLPLSGKMVQEKPHLPKVHHCGALTDISWPFVLLPMARLRQYSFITPSANLCATTPHKRWFLTFYINTRESMQAFNLALLLVLGTAHKVQCL